jgi:uncharacterized Fe-S cluster-containing radical SAM superfamily protein
MLLHSCAICQRFYFRESARRRKEHFSFSRPYGVSHPVLTSASAVTDIYYIAGKSLEKTIARETIKKMLQVFQPAAVTGGEALTVCVMCWFLHSNQLYIILSLQE